MSPSSRERLERVRQQQRKAARRRQAIVGALVVVVLVVVVGAGVAVQMSSSDDGPVVPPANTEGPYGIAVGDMDAPVTMVAYEDFQCPACRAVEGAIGDTVDELVDDGTVRLVYRPIAFLDRASSTNYSSRAANAAACVLDGSGPAAYRRLHGILFANQPPEGGDGLTDDRLTDLAVQAGAERAQVSDCIDAQTFAAWVDDATDQSSRDGVNQTPTILIDGEPLQLTSSEPPAKTLRDAVEAAQ